jgi:hypothetical protein
VTDLADQDDRGTNLRERPAVLAFGHHAPRLSLRIRADRPRARDRLSGDSADDMIAALPVVHGSTADEFAGGVALHQCIRTGERFQERATR